MRVCFDTCIACLYLFILSPVMSFRTLNSVGIDLGHLRGKGMGVDARAAGLCVRAHGLYRLHVHAVHPDKDWPRYVPIPCSQIPTYLILLLIHSHSFTHSLMQCSLTPWGTNCTAVVTPACTIHYHPLPPLPQKRPYTVAYGCIEPSQIVTSKPQRRAAKKRTRPSSVKTWVSAGCCFCCCSPCCSPC